MSTSVDSKTSVPLSTSSALSKPTLGLLAVIAVSYISQQFNLFSEIYLFLTKSSMAPLVIDFVNDILDICRSQLFVLLLKLCVIAAVLYVTKTILIVLFSRTEHVRKLGEVPVAWVTKQNQMNSKLSTNLQKEIDIEHMPPAYPNGWYLLVRSEQLSAGDVMDVSMCGLSLVLFRANDGTNKIGLFDKYCPHLGANLAVGGTVDGDCLKCPFHGWSFSAEGGQCVSIQYADKADRIPKHATVKCYQALEKNQLIYLWYDAQGREPWWIPETMGDNFTYHGRCAHEVACHIQEVPENGADVAHLGVLHPPSMFGDSFLTHQFDAVWTAGKDRENGVKEFAYIDMDEYFKFNRHEIPGM